MLKYTRANGRNSFPCKIFQYYKITLLQKSPKLTLAARPSRTAATTTAQAPVPQASVAPTIESD